MKKCSFKRLGALAMSLIMCLALAVSASAKGGTNVTIYKDNGTDVSMADDAVAGNAVISTAADGNVQIDIPIQPLYNYTAMGVFTADGYLTEITVSNAISAEIIDKVANTGDRSGTPYASATLRIVAAGLPADGRFVVSASRINLYDVGKSSTYWMSHVSPSFIIDVNA